MTEQELKPIYKQCKDKSRLKFAYDALKAYNKETKQQYETRGWKGLLNWAYVVAPLGYTKHLGLSSSLESRIELLFYNVGLI